jgi:tRNA A-37 threonylcarbamoyl transferase component Bud32
VPARFAIPGYERAEVDGARIVALTDCLPDVKALVARQRLYEFAAAQPDSRVLEGRGPAYAVALPGACGRVVVRHARHGGMLAPFLGDVYVARLRPLRELIASYRLRMVGVPSPELVAYVTYPAGVVFRYDVATREVREAADLAARLADITDEEERAGLLHSTAVLLERMADAGAHHDDLNAKNILLARSASGYLAAVIDVDRVRFHVPRSPMVMGANLDRLERSLRKLRSRGLHVTDAEIRALRLRANDLLTRSRAAPDS